MTLRTPSAAKRQGISAPIALITLLLTLVCAYAAGEAVKPAPQVTASSVYVVNADTSQVLYRKNENKPARIHSLTKLVTADVLVERLGDRLSDTVTITQAHLTTGASAGLRPGDVWTLEDLLAGLLLVSGNDAALAIADHAGRAILAQENRRGDAKARFVQEMQSTVATLGAKDTKLADPNGLSPANVSTARDIGEMGRSIFRDQRLLPLWRCKQRALTIGGSKARTVTLASTVEILGESGIVGAKTGSHFGQGIFNLVAAWRAPNGQIIVAVVMGSKDNAARYADLRAILDALPRDFPHLAEPLAASAPKPSCP